MYKFRTTWGEWLEGAFILAVPVSLAWIVGAALFGTIIGLLCAAWIGAVCVWVAVTHD